MTTLAPSLGHDETSVLNPVIINVLLETVPPTSN